MMYMNSTPIFFFLFYTHVANNKRKVPQFYEQKIALFKHYPVCTKMVLATFCEDFCSFFDFSFNWEFLGDDWILCKIQFRSNHMIMGQFQLDINVTSCKNSKSKGYHFVPDYDY